MSISRKTMLSRATLVRADAIDLLALINIRKRFPLQVGHSDAGHDISTLDTDGPISRRSVSYLRSYQAACQTLKTDRRQQRRHP